MWPDRGVCAGRVLLDRMILANSGFTHVASFRAERGRVCGADWPGGIHHWRGVRVREGLRGANTRCRSIHSRGHVYKTAADVSWRDANHRRVPPRG